MKGKQYEQLDQLTELNWQKINQSQGSSRKRKKESDASRVGTETDVFISILALNEASSLSLITVIIALGTLLLHKKRRKKTVLVFSVLSLAYINNR